MSNSDQDSTLRKIDREIDLLNGRRADLERDQIRTNERIADIDSDIAGLRKRRAERRSDLL